MSKIFLRIRGRLGMAWVHFCDLFATRTVVVLGDSHASVFRHPAMKLRFPWIKFDVCQVGGATASGIENPNSQTQAYRIFDDRLERVTQDDTVIVQLGEVDTGFVIWYRAQKYQSSVQEMFDTAIAQYSRFLLKAKKAGTVIVVSAPLPTIRDGETWGEVANLRKEISVSQIQRTVLTIEFNHQMRRFCESERILYASLDEESLGRDGVVVPRLVSKDPADHHYDPVEYSALLKAKLKHLLQAHNA